jgi:hypothetical protein
MPLDNSKRHANIREWTSALVILAFSVIVGLMLGALR